MRYKIQADARLFGFTLTSTEWPMWCDVNQNVKSFQRKLKLWAIFQFKVISIITSVNESLTIAWKIQKTCIIWANH